MNHSAAHGAPPAWSGRDSDIDGELARGGRPALPGRQRGRTFEDARTERRGASAAIQVPDASQTRERAAAVEVLTRALCPHRRRWTSPQDIEPIAHDLLASAEQHGASSRSSPRLDLVQHAAAPSAIERAPRLGSIASGILCGAPCRSAVRGGGDHGLQIGFHEHHFAAHAVGVLEVDAPSDAEVVDGAVAQASAYQLVT